jgi:hypothetical protein
MSNVPGDRQGKGRRITVPEDRQSKEYMKEQPNNIIHTFALLEP